MVENHRVRTFASKKVRKSGDIGLTRDRLQQLAAILGIEVEDFFSTHDRPKRNGPVGRARKSFETISSLPRNRQKQILDVIDVLMRKEITVN